MNADFGQSATSEESKYASCATVLVLAGFLGISLSDIEENHIPLWVLEQSAMLKSDLFGRKKEGGVRKATQADMDQF